MNRENKLAIIIGFSLVLVVAVLISDHFSRARTIKSGNDIKVGTAEDFGAGAPGGGMTRALGPQDPTPVGAGPLLETTPRIVEAANGGSTPHAPDVIDMGKTPGPAPSYNDEVTELPRPAEGVAQIPTKPFSNGEMRFHDIKGGDSLYRLAEKYYGSGSFFKELAAYNKSKVTDAANLRQGVRIEIPPKDVLLGEAVMPPPGAIRPTKENTGGRPKGEKPAPPDRQVAVADKAKTDKAKTDKKKPTFDTYKIVRGDDLSSIAKKLLGDARRAAELYKLNMDVLEDEHTLVAGTVIKVPVR